MENNFEGKLEHHLKDTILVQPGSKKIKGFYVEKGLLRSYTIDDKGKEHIFMFAPEGWFIGDLEAVGFDKQTELYIDCIEDSTVYMFNESQLIRDDNRSPSEMAASIKGLIRRAGVLQRRVLMLMSSRAIDRYQHFVATYPKLTQRVPQRMIASYLGITPEALSKVRSEQLK